MKSWIFIFVGLALASVSGAGPKKKMKKGGFSDVEASLSALWTKVNRMSAGVQIHLHGMDDAKPHMDKRADGTHVHLHMHMDRDDHPGRDRHAKHLSDDHENEYHYGICKVVSNTALPNEEQQPISGNIFFRQKHGEHLQIKVHLEGFDMSGEHASHLHGLHVHEYGDMSDSCNSLGSHFNPDKNDHGGPHNETRHCGDYGNVECDDEGVVHRTFYDDHTSLGGRYSILGRSIVIHESADDLGSESDASGGAGKRLACCIVVGSKELDWDTIHGDHEANVVVEEHEHRDMSHSHHKHRGHDQGSNDDTHHRYSHEDTSHGYHDGHEDHKGHEHENHPYHPGHENHEGHVHPDEHDPNHEGHADHVGHSHEDHPDHPGHELHMGHDHPDEDVPVKKNKKRGGRGKKKGKRSKTS